VSCWAASCRAVSCAANCAMSCRAASRQAASRRVVPPTADERQLGSGGGGGVHRGRRQSSGSSIACLLKALVSMCAERGRCPSAHHPFSRVYNSIRFYTVLPANSQNMVTSPWTPWPLIRQKHINRVARAGTHDSTAAVALPGPKLPCATAPAIPAVTGRHARMPLPNPCPRQWREGTRRQELHSSRFVVVASSCHAAGRQIISINL
jgi:hypothetical protein